MPQHQVSFASSLGSSPQRKREAGVMGVIGVPRTPWSRRWKVRMQRHADPSDVVAFLLLDDAGFVTGAVYNI